MYFLLLSIVSSSFIIVIFKLIGRYRAHTLSTIIVNYPIACIAGFFLTCNFSTGAPSFHWEWLPISVFLGLLFIVMFWFIGTSTKRAGISVTTVAAKMSVVIPISFSIWYDPNDLLTPMKLLGIALALLAVLLAVYSRKNTEATSGTIIFPLVIFVGLGIMDSTVKFAQTAILSQETIPLFTTATFGFACLLGLLIVPFSKTVRQQLTYGKSWLFGISLGLLNFGSMYFLIRALAHIQENNSLPTDGSIVFGINNISIVALSVLIGLAFFKERPSLLNWLGISLAGVAIIILSFS